MTALKVHLNFYGIMEKSGKGLLRFLVTHCMYIYQNYVTTHHQWELARVGTPSGPDV